MMQDELFLPQGPPPGASTRQVVQGILLAVDADRWACQVSIAGGDGAWMSYVSEAALSDFIGQPVWVLREVISGQASLCLGLVKPGTATSDTESEAPLPRLGVVTSVSPLIVTAAGESFECQALMTYSVRNVADVVLLYWADSSAPYVLGQIGTTPTPGTPGTPSGLSLSRSGSAVTATWTKVPGSTTSSVRFSTNNGRTWQTRSGLTGSSVSLPIAQGQTLRVQVRAAGPGGTSDWSSTVSVSWAKPAPPAPKVETRTVTITPTWSGSYRHAYNQWDRWNTNRYGGRSTLWQGSKYGSGQMTGLATYGNKLRELGADEITSIEVTLRGVGLNSDLPSIVLRGSPHGSRPGGAPSSSGDTASGQTGSTSASKVRLPASVREAFRTGAVKGLALVGDRYGGVRGTSAADGMALRVTYKVTI